MKACIIGFNYWGKKIFSVLQRLKKNNINLISICDKKFKDVSPDLDPTIRIYSCVTELLKNETLDMVFIASSYHSHFDIVKKVLLNKVHCFVEKPFTLSLLEAENILSFSQQYPNIILYPSHIFHFDDRIDKFLKHYKAMKETQKLKKITFYYSNPSPREPIQYALLPHIFYLLFQKMSMPFPIKIQCQYRKEKNKNFLTLLFSFHHKASFPKIKIVLIQYMIPSFRYIIEYCKKPNVSQKITNLLDRKEFSKFNIYFDQIKQNYTALKKPKRYESIGYIFKKQRYAPYHFCSRENNYPSEINHKFFEFQEILKLAYQPIHKDYPHFVSLDYSLYKKLLLISQSRIPTIPNKNLNIIESTPLYKQIKNFIEAILNDKQPFSLEEIIQPYRLELFEFLDQFSFNENFSFSYYPFKRGKNFITQENFSHPLMSHISSVHQDSTPSRTLLFGFESESHPHLNPDYIPNDEPIPNNNPFIQKKPSSTLLEKYNMYKNLKAFLEEKENTEKGTRKRKKLDKLDSIENDSDSDSDNDENRDEDFTSLL